MHRLVVGYYIVEIGILIGPEAVWNCTKKFFYASDTCLQELSGKWIGLGDEIDLRAVHAKDFDVLLCGLQINDADEAYSEIPARLGQPDAHVPGTGFNDCHARFQQTFFDSFRDDAKRSPVFYASCRIESFQFRVQVEARVVQNSFQLYKWGISDGRKNACT